MSVKCPKDSRVRERRDEHHMLLHDSISRLSVDLINAESEIRQLKARVIELEMRLYPVIEERVCG